MVTYRRWSLPTSAPLPERKRERKNETSLADRQKCMNKPNQQLSPMWEHQMPVVIVAKRLSTWCSSEQIDSLYSSFALSISMFGQLINMGPNYLTNALVNYGWCRCGSFVPSIGAGFATSPPQKCFEWHKWKCKAVNEVMRACELTGITSRHTLKQFVNNTKNNKCR